MKTIKRLAIKSFSKLNYPLLINSYGRSGSTVLKNSIVRSAIRNSIFFNKITYMSISQEAWDLDNAVLKDGILYKTHDYPPQQIPNKNLRMIYIFANPTDVVLSLLRLYNEKGEEWMKLHYSHLKINYGNFHNIIREDQLQLKQHLDSWIKEKRFPTLFIKYEKLWDYQDDISSFLGFNMHLPVYRVRKSKSKANDIGSKELEMINETYRDLKKKISSLDDLIIKNY